MEFSVSSFQFDPGYLFEISYKVDSYLSRHISDLLSDVDSGFNLIFSISCYSDNPDKLIFKDQMRGRKKPKEITQFLSFPHNDLEYRDDWILELSSFDFNRKKNAYRAYPLDKYVSLITESLNQFFQNEKIDANLNFEQIKKELIQHFNQNKAEYAFMNEELMNLEELINGTHHSFTESDGQEWQQSEIGQKWLRLKDKYSFDQNGELIEK